MHQSFGAILTSWTGGGSGVLGRYCFLVMKMPFIFFFGSCNFFTFGSFLVCFVLIYLLFDLMLGFEMEANNKTKDDGSTESPTSVLEDEVCFVFFVWCSSTKNKPSGLICCELWSWAGFGKMFLFQNVDEILNFVTQFNLYDYLYANLLF